MLDLQTFGVFSLACVALTVTPGPDMLLIASRSMAQGRMAGFATLAGIQLGTYCHALAAAYGLSQLFIYMPVAYDFVRYLGAAYLLYLAWKAFTSASQPIAASPAEARYASWTVFRQGLLTNLLNPKMALFVLALFPQFVHAGAGSVPLQVMILATILNGIGFAVNGSVIYATSRFRAHASGSRFGRYSQYLLGTIFGGLALRIAFDSRR